MTTVNCFGVVICLSLLNGVQSFTSPFVQQLGRISRRQLLWEHNIIANPSITATATISQYKYIPLDNSRVLQIRNLQAKSQEKEIGQLRQRILTKAKPIIEDLQTVQDLELKLLDRGLYATCNWEKTLPPPLDKDEQCSEAELKFILNNSEALSVNDDNF